MKVKSFLRILPALGKKVDGVNAGSPNLHGIDWRVVDEPNELHNVETAGERLHLLTTKYADYNVKIDGILTWRNTSTPVCVSLSKPKSCKNAVL